MNELAIGSNVLMSVEGDNVLVLRIDLRKSIGPSKSGKNVLIGSTGGNVVLPNGERIGVNCYRPIAKDGDDA